jgi:hypothetical protein
MSFVRFTFKSFLRCESGKKCFIRILLRIGIRIRPLNYTLKAVGAHRLWYSCTVGDVQDCERWTAGLLASHPHGKIKEKTRILDLNFSIPEPGSKRSRIRISIKEFKYRVYRYLTHKSITNFSEISVLWNVDPWHFVKEPDPAFFVSGWQDANCK